MLCVWHKHKTKLSTHAENLLIIYCPNTHRKSEREREMNENDRDTKECLL